jgi:hypothetical protein
VNITSKVQFTVVVGNILPTMSAHWMIAIYYGKSLLNYMDEIQLLLDLGK